MALSNLEIRQIQTMSFLKWNMIGTLKQIYVPSEKLLPYISFLIWSIVLIYVY